MSATGCMSMAGRAYQVFKGVVYFCNYADQRIYRQAPGKEPQPLTPESQDRYADLTMDEQHQRLICIREQHGKSEQDVTNSVVAIPLDGKSPVEVLVSGNDFYSNPRLSPDGRSLCWLTWNHPNMPWDGCELWVGSFDDAGKIIQYPAHRRWTERIDFSTRMVTRWRIVLHLGSKWLVDTLSLER